ncbi:hypothetical protein Tco_1547300 [Tanacetum coccineum]
MSAKDFITTQTCELSQEEFNDFLALYPIPYEYHVILPISNQTVFDAPPGYVGLYTHSFSLTNLRLSLTEFFCEVLEYIQVHILRLNPFGCAKLTTFVVMCKAYGCNPSVDLFRGFFNLCRDGKWMMFAKRSKKHIPNLLPKVITCIEDKLPPNIEENPMFQCLSRYPTSVRMFHDPILFLAGLKPSWEHVNTEPLKANEEPDNQPVEVTADSGGSPKPELFVVHPGSVATRIKDRKCKTRGESSRPPVKRKLASGSSTSRATRAKTSSSKDDAPFLIVFDDDKGLPNVLELKYDNACHLKISTITPLAWKNHLDNHIDLELLDLHDLIEKLRGECDVMMSRERARDEECKGLQVKCEATMTDFEKNPTVLALREKIFVIALESEKARLKAVEVSLRKEVEELKQDRREVVSKFIPYAAMELVHSDDMRSLVGKLVSFAIVFGRCRAFEQVAGMKEPFNLSNVKGYRSSYKKDHTQASNDLATATFPWLDKFVADLSAPIEAL